MKLISTLITILLVTGCTSMKPVELSPNQLHDRIAAGEVVHEGDTVRIVTADGTKYKFEITAITAERIVGNEIEVPIADIVAIELNEYSRDKTGGLTLISFVLVMLAVVAASTF